MLLYSPPALLGALFDDEAVARYSRVFTLLLQCLYAKHVLELVPLARMPPSYETLEPVHPYEYKYYVYPKE